MAESLLEKVKMAIPLSTGAYDGEIQDLISAAKLDLGIAGVVLPEELDALVERAVITYCKVHFGDATDGQYDRLKASYDEQKAQLGMATGYTDWGAPDGTV